MAKLTTTISYTYTAEISGAICVETDKPLPKEEGKALIAKMAIEDSDKLCDLIFEGMSSDPKEEARDTARLMTEKELWEVYDVRSSDGESKETLT